MICLPLAPNDQSYWLEVSTVAAKPQSLMQSRLLFMETVQSLVIVATYHGMNICAALSTAELAVSENWWDYVSNLMPFEVSGLHIFDGEKIGSLAEGEESASTLRSAINDLLGLSLAEQLIQDLQTLAKKKRQTLIPDSASAEDLKLQADIEVARKVVEDGRLDLGDLRNQLDRARMLVDSTTHLLASAGGDLWEQRLEIVEAHQRHLDDLREIEESLRASMSGPLPLEIIRSSLTELQDLAIKESLIQKQRLLMGGETRFLKELYQQI